MPCYVGRDHQGKEMADPRTAQERRRVRALLKTARGADVDEDWANYREALRNLKYQICKTKRQEWRKSCTQTLDGETPQRRVKLSSGGSGEEEWPVY